MDVREAYASTVSTLDGLQVIQVYNFGLFFVESALLVRKVRPLLALKFGLVVMPPPSVAGI